MRILEVCVDLDGGGIDRYLLNYCSRIKDIQFDFAIIDKDKKGILEAPIEEMGGRILKVPRQSAGIGRYISTMRSIMRENSYDAVHIHLGYKSLFALLCACSCGIQTRIVHAHIAYVPESPKEHIIRKLMTVPVKWLATSLAACGIDAGRWVWGDRSYGKGLVSVHNNAIQVSKFRFSLSERNRLRNELGVTSDTLIFGHVGRLCDQKNQLRLLDIYAEIVKRVPNSRLMLIGRGEQEMEIREKAKALHIENKVVLLGVRDDVHILLSAMDAFVFPSKYEGLPFTLIETQCNGLPAISSDIVTPQVRVSGCIEFIPLDRSDSIWADKAIQLAALGHDDRAWKSVQEAGYDIDVEAQKLRKYYFECVEEKHGRKRKN